MPQKLTDTIHLRAQNSWASGPVTKENYNLWARHWIDCAKIWREELASEGLADTVAAIDKIIEFNQRIVTQYEERK